MVLHFLKYKEKEEIIKEVVIMVGYSQLAKLNTFTMEDVFKLVGNKKSASSLVLRLSKKGYIKKIRNNLYTAVNIGNGQVYASKYHIACAINDKAYISHHSAFQYMGMTNQVFYEVYVSSEKRFNDFEFEGISYKYVESKSLKGVIAPKNTRGILVTDLERTLVDSIKDFEKIAGLEELIYSIEMITFLNENKLITYLEEYDLQFLYQKVGYILEQFQEVLNLSNDFISYCKSKIGKSTRYFTSESNMYLGDWQLVVPKKLLFVSESEGGPLV